jgi:hypothetical protein
MFRAVDSNYSEQVSKWREWWSRSCGIHLDDVHKCSVHKVVALKCIDDDGICWGDTVPRR